MVTHTHERERERETDRQRQRETKTERENTSFTWNSHNTFNKILLAAQLCSQNRTTINKTAKRTYTVDIPLVSVFLLQSGKFKIMITVMLYELGELPVHLDRSL